MALKRIFPCLLYDGSGLVKTVRFQNPSYIGDPINAIKIYNEKEVDELALIDINASKQKRRPNFEKIADMAGEAFMPFAYGGGVKTFDDFARLYRLGVEKVIVNSLIFENPTLIREVAAQFGSQAIVASIDVKTNFLRKKKVYSYSGYKTGLSITDFAEYVARELSVGEIMLQSVDKEGTWEGFDTEITKEVVNSVELPVIASGGCGTSEDIVRILYEADASAAAIGSMAVYSKKGMGVLINFPDRSTVIREN